jgi:dihydrofolate synthase / folylpolyglutamate synthase
VAFSFYTALFLWLMNYDQTIEYLFTRLPMFSRIGSAAYKADLSNTIQLCEALHNPQEKIKTIHIAGTNGKGSVSHMLAAIFQTAGYKTGLYTSPHLKDFRERIRIDGEMIQQDFVVDFTERIQPLIEKIEPSFFEITVAMAFEYFAEQEVDIAIIETGLGGRLDSTNIITPELSIITNIGWDHMNLLGDTIEKITMEKAGIIKTGVPVVIGEIQTETRPLFEEVANKKNAPVFFAEEQRTVNETEWKNKELEITVTNANYIDKKKYTLDLPGIYQTKNLLTVLAACDQLELKGWRLPNEDITKALKETKKITGLHGRWEIIHEHPLVVLDVAHNINGIEQLLLQIENIPHKNLHIIFGTVRDKDADKVLALLPKEATYYFTKAQIPRALPEDELLEKAIATGLTGKTFPNVNFALYSVAQKAGKDDLIIVCGSIFLVGEVSIHTITEYWGKEKAGIWYYLIEAMSFYH